MILISSWVLVIVVEVQFALKHKLNTILTEEYKTERDCEYAKKKLIDSFPEAIDEAWCEPK